MLDKEMKHMLFYIKVGDDKNTSIYLFYIKPTNS